MTTPRTGPCALPRIGIAERISSAPLASRSTVRASAPDAAARSASAAELASVPVGTPSACTRATDRIRGDSPPAGATLNTSTSST